MDEGKVRSLRLDFAMSDPPIPRRSSLFKVEHDRNDVLHNSCNPLLLSDLSVPYQNVDDLYSTPTSLEPGSAGYEPIIDNNYTDGASLDTMFGSPASQSSHLPKKLHYLEKKCEIDFKQLELFDKLGEGAFGEVWRGTLWGLEVAVKILKGNFLHCSPLEELVDEVALLKSLRHPNCVLFLGFTSTPSFCIITEFLSLGSLRSLIESSIRLPPKIIVKIALSIARGMNYLHTQSPAILHRDLNSHNILCSDNWTIKVADYGLSRTTDARMDFCGAIPWRAPEVKSGFFLPESDVFSFGVILWELVTREIPWKGVEMANVVAEVKSGNRPIIPEDCLPLLSKLIQSCWQQDCTSRPSFHEIIETLKPYEIKRSSFTDCSLYSMRPTRTPSGNYEEELMFSDDKSIVARCWESYFNVDTVQSGINFAVFHDNAMSCFIEGSLCLADSWGRLMWIVGIKALNGLYQEEEYMKCQQKSLQTLTVDSIAPFSRQTMKMTDYNLRSGATHATSTHIQVQEGLADESLKLYEEKCLKILEGHTSQWCGTLILSDSESSGIIIITLFSCAEIIGNLGASGFHEELLEVFQNLLIDLPVFHEYSVKHDTLSKPAGNSVKLDGLVPHPMDQISRSRKNALEFANERVLASFFCILLKDQDKSWGHLFICEQNVRFKGREKIVGKERVVTLHLSNIVSLDENRPFGRSGHSIVITTKQREVFILRSLLQREKVCSLIIQQASKLKPSHAILLLINGEPNF